MRKNCQIAVIGGGLMGHGIALTLARANQYVNIAEPNEEVRATLVDRIVESLKLLGEPDEQIAKILKKIVIDRSLEKAVKDADFVFEAIPEKLDLKRSIFAQIEAHAPKTAILASNTSVMPITEIMAKLDEKSRTIGTHWWNPPHMIPLVEVVKTEATSDQTAKAMFDLLADAGKTPVMVEKDVPGFIGNRLQHALWREAISLVEKGICTADAVDDVVKASFGRRLAVLGPLENADLVGIELTKDIHHQVLFDLDRREEPSPYLDHLLEEGRTGMSAGAGFRDWEDADLAATKEKIATHLRKLEGILPK